MARSTNLAEGKSESGTRIRELTTLEYVILGFLAAEPRSGYTIITSLESGVYRASASTGSIYPLLKRLEKAGLIASALEVVHEMRPRKVYRLLPQAETVLDDWLRRPPTISEVIEEYDIAMHKFLASESRLRREEILTWLDGYENVVQVSLSIRTALDQLTQHETQISLHTQLVNQSLILEIGARLAWIQTARLRLNAHPEQHEGTQR